MNSRNEFEILIIEDQPTERAAVERLLTEAGYNVKTTDSAEKALRFVGEGIDCVVAGVVSGAISRVDVVKHWKNYFPTTPLPMIHETQSVTAFSETISTGMFDGLHSLADAKQMLTQLRALVQACQHEQTLQAPAAATDGTDDGIIGQTKVMHDVFDLIFRASQAFSTVLILGESGTGKDLAAQAIHRNSRRKASPFIAFNCAAVPDTLVESELFGYEKGAFTGSSGTKMGLFEASNGGTLFIDEIGDCALPIQAKLLRILENRIVTPLGGHREIKVDTRVVVATSRDLPDMVAKGTFREDLYYRLNIITIRMPPLRDRREDIPLLVSAFIARTNLQAHSSIEGISVKALAALQEYRWPGNVRQLLNVIERAVVLSDNAKKNITLADFPDEIAHAAETAEVLPQIRSADVVSGANAVAESPEEPVKHRRATDADEPILTLAQLEEHAIQAALIRFDNNKTKAAHAIGISVRTLQRKLAQRETPSLVLLSTDMKHTTASEK